MSLLIIGRQRHELPVGETLLGGGGHDAVIAPAFANQPLTAVITVRPDGTAAIRRVTGEVRVDREPVTDVVALQHGMRLDVAGVTMLYGDRAAVGTTSHVVGVSDEELALLAELAPPEPTAPTGGRLVDAATGTTYPVPDVCLEIGRDPACDVALLSKDVSRVHARIAPGTFGYVLTNLGANGTSVNGTRVTGTRLLGNGDVLRFGSEDFRFFADAATYPVPMPASPPPAPTPASHEVPSVPTRFDLFTPVIFATLEVVSEGALQGTRIRIERPVARVGRAPDNDVRLREPSVSNAHATLTRRVTGWVLFDLDSTNGTFVNGERVTGERRLESGCELRFGNVRVVFRAMQGPDRDDSSARALAGLPDDGGR